MLRVVIAMEVNYLIVVVSGFDFGQAHNIVAPEHVSCRRQNTGGKECKKKVSKTQTLHNEIQTHLEVIRGPHKHLGNEVRT